MNKLGAALLVGLSLVGIVGCSSAIAMTPDSTVPFAVGQIDVVAGDGANGNGSYTVRVEHLGDPGKLDARRRTYSCGSSRQGRRQGDEHGPLSVDSSQSAMSPSTAFKEFEVSAPQSATDAAAPSGRIVLKRIDVD